MRATGSIAFHRFGNLLTMSAPSLGADGKEDWKGWRVASTDHQEPDPVQLEGFAIGMKVEGLNKTELVSNLELFTNTGQPVAHSDVNCYVEDSKFLLLGGGFEVLKDTC